MTLNLQGKLLRVLQEKEIRRVGGVKQIPVDARVIAASNENLEALIAEGKFREDLYYRLSVIPLTVPPLRERPEDILPLVSHVLRQVAGPNVPLPQLSSEAQLVLESYPWPGNVRELENAVRHACTFADNGRILPEDLPAKIVSRAHAQPAAPRKEISGGLFSGYQGRSLKGFLRDIEKTFILNAIERNGGDKDKAAKELKVSLATLYRKLPDPDS